MAGAQLHAKADARAGHKITVINLAGTSRFPVVGSEFCGFLIRVKRLHHDIGIKNPWQAKNGEMRQGV